MSRERKVRKRRTRRKRRFGPITYKPISRFRRRSEANTNIVCGVTEFTSNGGRTWTNPAVQTYNVTTAQRPYRYEEATWDQLNPGPPYRSGGRFMKFRYEDPLKIVQSGVYYGWMNSTLGWRYSGGFVPACRPGDFGMGARTDFHDATLSQTSWSKGNGDVSSYGAKGWNKYRPGNPTADLGVFLGELRDMPRMLEGTANFFHNLWRSRGGRLTGFGPKAVADHWLNTQFGWMPFISDLRKFIKTIEGLDSLVKQAVRDNGQWIRRRGSVSREVGVSNESSSATVTSHWPVLQSTFYQNGQITGSTSKRVVTVRNVWFEGAFRYWIEDVESPLFKPRMAAELFGVMPTPSLIWNLIPWSWLVDWCANTSDVIANMSTGYADNLASKYAYVMGTTSKTGICESTHRLKGGNLYDSWSFPLEWKDRTAASPFGFGLSTASFSDRQWSILGALGLSRLKLS